ncbi:MAG: tyrosine-type recombinase/integrase [Eubacteriales bacterium]
MSKRGTNIYKRKDGRWEARYVSTISAEGTKKYVSVYGSSYREAREKQLACMQNTHFHQCNHVNLTLSELMWEWLYSITNTVKKSTYQKYESIIRNHIDPDTIGKIPIKYMNGQIINSFADKKLYADLPLSAKSVNDILIEIGLALSYAEENYALPKPKFHHVKVPHEEMRVLSVCEQRKLEVFLRQDMDLYKFGVLLALYTGMRVGELCALQWEDIGSEYIVINKTLHRIKNGNKTIIEVTEPKTKTSNRLIPIPRFLLPVVAQFRALGSVMKNRNGKPVEPRLMQLTFEKYIAECDLPKTNFHALRHTFATRCIEAGFDIKSLSEILGHTDVKTTLNKYVHSSLEQKQKNMELLKPITDL